MMSCVDQSTKKQQVTSDEYNKKNLLAAALSEARAVILYEQCGSAYKF